MKPGFVSCVRLTPAHAAEAERGLLGYVALVLDDVLELRGLALRRTRRGELRLAFPERRGRGGRRHPLVRPTTAVARAAIESQVLAALGLEVET